MDKLLKKKELKFRKIMAASFIFKTIREKINRLKGDTKKNLKNNVRL
jgi:hypothetical protein